MVKFLPLVSRKNKLGSRQEYTDIYSYCLRSSHGDIFINILPRGTVEISKATNLPWPEGGFEPYWFAIRLEPNHIVEGE